MLKPEHHRYAMSPSPGLGESLDLASPRRASFGSVSSPVLVPDSRRPRSFLEAGSKVSQHRPGVLFEVETHSGRTILEINTAERSLTIIPSNNRQQTYITTQISEVVRDAEPCNLSLYLKEELGSRRDVREVCKFSSPQHCAAFCQLIFELKKAEPQSFESRSLSVYIGSFNMGNSTAPVNLRSWFECKGEGKTLHPYLAAIPHDIYVFGTQETCQLAQQDWIAKLRQLLRTYTGKVFALVASEILWGLRIVIFIKELLHPRVTEVETDSVRTGVANTLGNKGGVAVSFKVDHTSFCFICAHLTSGSEKLQRRNDNIYDILRNLSVGKRRQLHPDVVPQFDHVFWLGDLNYRLDGQDDKDAEKIIHGIRERNYGELLPRDQLNQERHNGTVYSRFDEDEITFAPTYRYSIGTRASYNYRKEKKLSVRINVPSWCDRVLRCSNPRLFAESRAYGCCTDIMTSDHSPVFSSFNVSIETMPSLPLQDHMQTGSKTPFLQVGPIQCLISSSSKGPFYLQFLCPGFLDSRKSAVNTTSVSQTANRELRDRIVKFSLQENTAIEMMNASYPMWDMRELSQLSVTPATHSKAFWQEQLLTICVCSTEDEVVGYGTLAMEPLIGDAPLELNLLLERYGKAVGFMIGRVCIAEAKAWVPQMCVRVKPSKPTVVFGEDKSSMRRRSLGCSELPRACQKIRQ